MLREWKQSPFSNCPSLKISGYQGREGHPANISLPGQRNLESWGPWLNDASISFLSCCFLKDFSSYKDSQGRRQVRSYVGVISCCFDGAVWLFKAIIKMLYHSLEQQNEFQSKNYCPIIFRIIKASSASIRAIASSPFAPCRPRPPPTASLPTFPVSSVCTTHFVKLNSVRRCRFLSEGVRCRGS